jgi:hypothetical protein
VEADVEVETEVESEVGVEAEVEGRVDILEFLRGLLFRAGVLVGLVFGGLVEGRGVDGAAALFIALIMDTMSVRGISDPGASL